MRNFNLFTLFLLFAATAPILATAQNSPQDNATKTMQSVAEKGAILGERFDNAKNEERAKNAELANAKAEAAGKILTTTATATPPASQGSTPNGYDPITELLTLSEQLRVARIGNIVTTRNISATQNAIGPSMGAKRVFNWKDGDIFEILCGLDRTTTIVLQKGERLTSPVVLADQVNWILTSSLSGENDTEQTHLSIKPTLMGANTNLFISTNKRTYYLVAQTADTYMPYVAWRYPEEEMQQVAKNIKPAKTKETLRQDIKYAVLNNDYTVSGNQNLAWFPQMVFNDGQKTWIGLSRSVLNQELPAVFAIDSEDHKELVNYHFEPLDPVEFEIVGDAANSAKNLFFIRIDRVLNIAALKLGEKEVTLTLKGFERSWYDIF